MAKSNNAIKNMVGKMLELAVSSFKVLLMLKQDEEEFLSMIRRNFHKRLRIIDFQDDGTGELCYILEYKHWYFIPFYFFFRDRKRILTETAIIIAEEYLFKLTDRQIKKGHTDFFGVN